MALNVQFLARNETVVGYYCEHCSVHALNAMGNMYSEADVENGFEEWLGWGTEPHVVRSWPWVHLFGTLS